MTRSSLEIALERIEECRHTRSTKLDLSRLGLEEIPEEVCDLTWLEHLAIYYNPISNLSSLANLPNLQILDCHENPSSELSSLPRLPNLWMLDCSANQINDLSPLTHLPTLQTLYCSHNQISDLSPLASLSHLQTLDCDKNQISDLGSLAHLSTLQMLYCSRNQISDLSPLANLPHLQILYCGYNQISDLSPLASLSHLQTLDCDKNQISCLLPIYSAVMSGQMKKLTVYRNPVAGGIPPVLLGKSGLDDCLESLKNYWQDLTKGSEKQQQLKVQLVGNGRVGKSTLAYALEHKKAPSESLKPTHGIIIKEIQQALDGDDEPVTLQLWDFGGQEIYHATHRLFLSSDCLYLLLWAEKTEEHPDETRHPVGYWLELIHDLAPNSQVIVVKNQIDRSDYLPTRPPELTDDMPGVSQIRQEVKISALQYRGIPALRGAIESVLEELKHQVCMELPTSWLQVQRELKQLDQKTIPFAHFKQLCIKAGIDHAEWFVDYLHKTGVLFYRNGAFQDQIILEQNWVIEAAYRVFDPKGHRELVEQMRGSFKGAYTPIFWPDVDETERKIYLGFMRNCGICYEPNHKHNIPFAERTFIIPALLPEDSTTRSAWQKNTTDWQLDIEYPFLHRSIIERIILRLGETYQGEPWRTGIFCNTEYGQVLLECVYRDKQQSTQGQLRFQLRGNQLAPLEYALRKLVSEISPHRRYAECLRKGTEESIYFDEFKKERESTSRLDDTKPADKAIKLFISYSRVDDAHKLRLEKHLKAISRTLPLTAWSDRSLFAGELVDEQIFQQLDTADIVLLLVSPDFINSDYCFTKEMVRALQRYREASNVVIPVIIRHTSSWRNHEIGQIAALPKDGQPLAQWDDEDEFWGSVEDGIHAQVEKLLRT